MRTLAISVALLLMSGIAAPVYGKSQTARIAITSPHLSEMLIINDPRILYRFSIWNGPGVQVDDPGIRYAGAFIDWRAGPVVERPRGLQRYDVSFFPERRAGSPAAEPMYVVVYEYDPSGGQGYFYLPGRNDENYRRNVSAIYHGVEGNWFYSSRSWEEIIRPLIDGARGE